MTPRRLVEKVHGSAARNAGGVDDAVDVSHGVHEGSDRRFICDVDCPDVVTAGHVRPNGLAYDPERDLLLAANVGDPARPESYTVSLVDVASHTLVADVPVAGRTRWAVFDGARAAFCVNIAGPPWIQIVDARTRLVTRTIPLAATGPHGLDLDAARRRLFCACDDGALIEVDLETWAPATRATLSGPPDVIFFNAHLRHLYVAVGEPGVIDVLDTESWRRIETMPTERGAHTLAFDARHDTVYAFLPESHRAAVYHDS